MTLKEAYIAFINLPMVLTRIADNYLEYKTGETIITYFDDRTISIHRNIIDSRFYNLQNNSNDEIVNKLERLVRFDKKYEGIGLNIIEIGSKLGVAMEKMYDDKYYTVPEYSSMFDFENTNKDMDLTVVELKEQFKNKIKTLLPELELISETGNTILYASTNLPLLSFLPLTIVNVDFQNQTVVLGKTLHKICGQGNKFNDFVLGLINDFMVVEMDKNIEKFPKVFEDFKNNGIFARYYEMKNNSLILKSHPAKSLPTQENKLLTVPDITSRNFDQIINYVLKKQQIYRLHKIYDNGLEFSAPGMFFGTIVAYDDDSKTVQIQHTRSYCNGRKTFTDQPHNVIAEYICELLNPHARLGAIVYEPIKEEKEIEHVVTPSTNYYLFRGLKTSN